MALNFVATGDFKPYVSYDAKSGRLNLKKDGVLTEITNPTFVVDFVNIQQAWLKFAAGQAPVAVPSSQPRPAEKNAAGQYTHKDGFIADLFSPKFFGGVVEFRSSADCVTGVMQRLEREYIAGSADHPGELPLVSLTGVVKEGKHGNYTPQMSITGWVKRPAEFDVSQPANESSAAPTAVQKVSVSEF